MTMANKVKNLKKEIKKRKKNVSKQKKPSNIVWNLKILSPPCQHTLSIYPQIKLTTASTMPCKPSANSLKSIEATSCYFLKT